MDIGVESFERDIELSSGRDIELSSEREKLGKGYWVFVIFFLLGFIINLLLLFLLRLDL